MSRVKRGFKARRRRKRVLALAKGYRGSRNSRFRTAIHVVRRALCFAYRDRRVKKRDFRRLWIIRINAAARACGLKYSELIDGLKKANVTLDRSVLADLAVKDQAMFAQIVETAKSARA
jgi:large subunit ribosomal protein L20